MVVQNKTSTPIALQYPPSLFLLLFTNTLQSHGCVMAGAPPLPLSSAVAKIQGVSYFDNSVLTQVRAEIFQLKNKTKEKKRPSVLVGLQAGTGFYILSEMFVCSTLEQLLCP